MFTDILSVRMTSSCILVVMNSYILLLKFISNINYSHFNSLIIYDRFLCFTLMLP